jgi:RNA polymerase sigma factor (sigma-70 family)
VAYAQRLTPPQEQELVIGAEAGDAEASRRLVEAFLPAIAAVAAHIPANGGVDRQDLVQEGVAGLLFAAHRYDARRSTPFWSYASFWVRKAMQELVAELHGPVALSDRAVRALAQLKLARREYVQAHGAEPTDADLSRATGFTRAQVERLHATARRPHALDDALADAVVDPGADEEYARVLDRLEIHEVRRLADQLDERERAVIRAHYGIGERARTLGEIGGDLGLTAERARQIEVEALRKLRERLSRSAPVAFDDA